MLYFAINMELEEESCKEDNSYRHTLVVLHMIHSVIDFLSTVLAFVVRLWMIYHTYKVMKIWSIPEAINEEKRADELSSSKTAQQLAEDNFYNEYEVEYEKRGKEVKEQMLPFVPWFLFPWLHFFVLTLINPHLLLTPWTHDHNEHRSEVIARSQLLYFGIVIVYFVQIAVQHACAMRMNQYHKDYHADMENRVVHKYERYTENPQTTTIVPSVPNDNPQTTTDVPLVPNDNPQITTIVPSVPNDNPQTTTIVPSVPNDNPQTTTDVPLVPNDNPQTTTIVPLVPNDNPQTTTIVPLVPNDNPQTTTIVPSVPDDSVVEKEKKYIFIASQISMKFKDEYKFDPTFLSFFPNVNVENPYYLLVFIVGIAVSTSKILYQ